MTSGLDSRPTTHRTFIAKVRRTRDQPPVDRGLHAKLARVIVTGDYSHGLVYTQLYFLLLVFFLSLLLTQTTYVLRPQLFSKTASCCRRIRMTIHGERYAYRFLSPSIPHRANFHLTEPYLNETWNYRLSLWCSNSAHLHKSGQ